MTLAEATGETTAPMLHEAQRLTKQRSWLLEDMENHAYVAHINAARFMDGAGLLFRR
ncbi:MAG: hypothetical protein AAFS10_04665 [Myxococcota bacterium]